MIIFYKMIENVCNVRKKKAKQNENDDEHVQSK